MLFSKKSRLEAEEAKNGATSVLRRFAIDSVAENPHDSMASALNLALNRTMVQPPVRSAITMDVRADEYSHFQGISLNPDSPDLKSVNETLNKEWQLFKQQEGDAKDQGKFRWKLFKKKSEGTKPQWQVDAKAGQPLSIEDIIGSVEDARAFWESKPRFAHGKAQEAFHTFCKNVHTHSNLLKCLPDQNQYFSVFCGVTTTLIKASVNHQRIAEVLGSSLSEISEALKDCEAEVKLMSTNDMHEAISSLYSHVFHFLASAMKWYRNCTSKRIFNSLTEDFSDNLQEQVTKIEKLCLVICRRSAVKSKTEVRQIKLLLEEVADQWALTTEELREERRKSDITWARMEAFGQQLASNLKENTQAWLHRNDSCHVEHSSSVPKSRRLTAGGDGQSAPESDPRHGDMAKTTTRSELQQWSAKLEDFTSNISEFLDLIDFSATLVETEAISAIRDWSQSPSSQALWIRGRFQEIYPSDTTAIAIKVTGTARAMAIPFLCFFFNIDDNDDEENPRILANPYESHEEALVVDFVYSLIRQLIDQLPANVNLREKRLKARLQRLNGSLDIICFALKILEELFIEAPATLFVIVDGVEKIAESNAELILSKVLLMLQGLTNKVREKKVTKILYTTAGTSDVLEDLDEDVLVKFEAAEGRQKHMKERLESLEDFSFETDATETGEDTDGGLSDDEFETEDWM